MIEREKDNKIVVKGAREHNLKNVSLEIPRDKFVVFTGLSGSGKSTLAFDTIFAEGQRRYLESLSSYARQFLGQMEKPDVDLVEGLSPAISIDQKQAPHNPRSTVGTVTEIHDYLRLLFAKIGRPHCPDCGQEIKQLSTEEIVDRVLDLCDKKGESCQVKIEILAPVVRARKGEYDTLLAEYFKRGFSDGYIDGVRVDLLEAKQEKLSRYKKHDIDIVVDTVEVSSEAISRIFEGVEVALKLTDGIVKIKKIIDDSIEEPKKGGENVTIFNQNFACPIHDVEFPELEPRLFSYNSPQGACPICEGLGTRQEIDEDLVIPDKNKTIAEGGILPWSYKRNGYYGFLFSAVCSQFGIAQHTRIKDLTEEDLKILLYGPGDDYDDMVQVKYRFKSGSGYYNVNWRGVVGHLLDRYRNTSSDGVRREIEKYMSKRPCSACGGTRYKKEPLLVHVGGQNIAQVSALSIEQAVIFFDKLKLNDREKLIANKILQEISSRLNFLVNVGLDYLTLSRNATTLSGGEAQRIRLASQIGNGLVGVLYILDEPSIGLHARDNQKLLKMLLNLRDLGNSVMVIEHDEETIRAADHLVDVGPRAGVHGGEVIHSGSVVEILKNERSITAQYLSGQRKIEIPKIRRPIKHKKMLVIKGAKENNLKNITVEIPTKVMTVVTGVSGSGKSTLVEDVFYKWMVNRINRAMEVPGKVEEIGGYHHVNKVIMIDQSPIGRTPRSNPATYIGAFTPIRKLFASTKEARARGYDIGRFSFNVAGGRCDVCKGDGLIKVEMQFMPDVYLPCDVCGGKRYNSETLRVDYRGKTISDVLEMTVDEATDFFEKIPDIHDKIKTLQDVGLGYIRLGQSATTLSGGEAQRVKLAAELSKKSTGNTLYILDEPTTGLHFEDVRKLLEVLGRLVDVGNTMVIIEHNMDVIKSADYIIDLGPEGGERGGRVVVTGTPEEVARHSSQSYTGKFLKEVLEKK